MTILKVHIEKKIIFWLTYIPTIIVDTFLNHWIACLNHPVQQTDNMYINAME